MDRPIGVVTDPLLLLLLHEMINPHRTNPLASMMLCCPLVKSLTGFLNNLSAILLSYSYICGRTLSRQVSPSRVCWVPFPVTCFFVQSSISGWTTTLCETLACRDE